MEAVKSLMDELCRNLRFFHNLHFQKRLDYDIIHPSKILLLPSNHAQAIEMIENNYIGKTLRVIARSADESNPYGGRYYLYAIE